MKVAGSARHALRGVFQKHQLGWNWSVSELNKWVRVLRKSLSHRPEGSDQETKALREGLRLAAGQLVQLEEAETFSEEQWSELTVVGRARGSHGADAVLLAFSSS